MEDPKRTPGVSFTAPNTAASHIRNHHRRHERDSQHAEAQDGRHYSGLFHGCFFFVNLLPVQKGSWFLFRRRRSQNSDKYFVHAVLSCSPAYDLALLIVLATVIDV